ncbi:MAG: hypothetical protein ACR2PL_23985 [Dehalococcoidia bacterium]
MATIGRYGPCAEIHNILAPAFQPCHQFEGVCKATARWDPDSGYVPRGFIGAWRELSEVELVLVCAEPGNPQIGEHYNGLDSSPDRIEFLSRSIVHYLQPPVDLIQKNQRKILDMCWPGMELSQQLRRAWITNSYLCSAPKESGDVPVACTRACSGEYLLPQLQLLHDRAIVACGKKAKDRIKDLQKHRSLDIELLSPDPVTWPCRKQHEIEVVTVSALAAPGGNMPGASQSWKCIPAYLERSRRLRIG